MKFTDTEKALDYYKSGLNGIPPAFIPKRILLPSTVRGDGPFNSVRANEGEHECSSNRFGAVSVKASDGSLLGVKPKEFEVLEWTPNPHLDSRDLRKEQP